MSNNWGQQRICVEKILPMHQEHLEKLKEKSQSAHHFKKLRAAFLIEKLWPPGANITIGFLEDGTGVPRTSTSRIEQTVDQEGNKLKIDPLQKSIDNMTDIKEAVRKIVRERIIPLVGLNIKFVENPRQANIRVSFNPNGGAWSLIGTDCLHEDASKPTLNLGWFDVATTIHEFCHAMGMVHEYYTLLLFIFIQRLINI